MRDEIIKDCFFFLRTTNNAFQKNKLILIAISTLFCFQGSFECILAIFSLYQEVEI